MQEHRKCNRCGSAKPIEEYRFCSGEYRARRCSDCCKIAAEERRQEKIRTGVKLSLTCFTCGKEFKRPKAKQSKQSERSYCLNPCRPSPGTKGGDALSPFRSLFTSCAGTRKCGRGSARGLPLDIDPQYLSDMWVIQKRVR